MKKKILNILFVSSLLFAGSASIIAATYKSAEKHTTICEVEAKSSYAPGYTPTSTYTFGDGATYYNSISDSATGNALLSALQSLNSSKRKKTIGYSAGGTSASKSSFVYTDYATVAGHDQNGAPYGTTISSFYTYTTTTSFNKEHVWPDSRGGGTVEADIHMARPTISSENSNRGNSFYVEGKATQASGWDPYTAGYDEKSRGESARIIFYCMVANSNLKLIDQNGLASSEDGYSTTMGKLSDMLKWNLKYAVTQREKNRNEGAEYLQGNRNPFIDHPEYACKIWGNYNSATQAACAGQPSGGGGSGEGGEGGQGGGSDTPTVIDQDTIYYGKGQTINLNKGKTDIIINRTMKLVATTTDGSDVTWSFSKDADKFISYDTSKKTYKSGEAIEITALAKGTVIAYAKNVKTTELVACKLTLTNVNRPLVIGISVGVGSALLIAAVVVIVVVVVKKKHA